jgi:hypothetical protein
MQSNAESRRAWFTPPCPVAESGVELVSFSGSIELQALD